VVSYVKYIYVANTSKEDNVMIYAMQCLCPDAYIKIGRALDPWSRLSGMQSCCPYKLVLVRVLPVNQNVAAQEKRLHERFKEYHLRGEWYRPGAELMEEVSSWEKPDRRKFKGIIKRRRDKMVRKNIPLFHDSTTTQLTKQDLKLGGAIDKMSEMINKIE